MQYLNLFQNEPFVPQGDIIQLRGVTEAVTVSRPRASKVLIQSVNGKGFKFTLDGTNPVPDGVAGAVGFVVPIEGLAVGLNDQPSFIHTRPILYLTLGMGANLKVSQAFTNNLFVYGGAVDLDIQWGN